MAKFEKYKPQLKPGRITPQGNKLLFETDAPVDQVILPIENIDFMLLCTGEYSVAEIIELTYRRKGTIQFKSIYKILIFLKERGLLENGEQLELPLDSMPGKEIKFFSMQPLFELNIGRRIFNEKDRPLLFYFLAMFVSITALFSLQNITKESFSLNFLNVNSSFIDGLFFLVVGSSVLLSLKNFYKCLLLIFLTGRAYNFALAFNGFSFYFRVRNDSLFLVSNRFYLTLFYVATSLCYFSFVGLLYFLFPHLPYQNEVLSLAMLLFLFSINPFQESEASHLLRTYFNDDTLNKISSYLPHKSLIALINPSDHARNNNLYFYFSLFALAWTSIFAYCGYLTLHKYLSPIITTVKTAATLEKAAAVATIILLLTFGTAIILNVLKLLYLSLFLPISHAVFYSIRKVKSHRIEQFNNKEIFSMLEILPLFNYFNEETLNKIISQSEVKEYKVGSPVVIQGDSGTHLYVILSGRLQVRRRLPSGTIKKISEVLPPCIFGEIAVIEDTKRTADVIALTKSIILEIPAHVLREIAKNSQYVRELDGFRNAIMVNQFFSTAPIFRDLPETAVQLFIQKGKIESYLPDQIVFKQGDSGDGFYLLLRGSVGVSVNGRPVSRIQQGGFFGEISMITDIPRTATIYSIEGVQILKVSRDAFWEILSHDINMAMLIESVGEMRIREDIEIIKAGSTRVA